MSVYVRIGLVIRALVAATATAALAWGNVARADEDATRGAKRFEECAACHKLEAGANDVGPSLHGLFNRKAGDLADFRYSPALRRSGIVWTAQTLDTFLADPQKAVPANRMPYAGLPEAADRADLIAYLQQATK
jgi:cytochrome c